MIPRTIHRIQSLATRPLQPVTIQQLLARSAAGSEEDHIRHANWLREEMPIRLAHRLNDFIDLPFAVVCNSRVHEVFRLFLQPFETLSESPPIGENGQSVGEFAVGVRNLLKGHESMTHLLQEGYSELRDLFDGGLVDLDSFLHQTFFTRIGNQVLAEHFLSVHEARAEGPDANDEVFYGIVHPNCSPGEISEYLAYNLGRLCMDIYGVQPEVDILGEVNTEFSFVPEHLIFVLQEIIKNAFRATIEHHYHKVMQGGSLPHVTIEISKGSFDMTVKVSDYGGGMTRERLASVWKYGYTSAGEKTADNEASKLMLMLGPDPAALRQMAGYGFGLPLSRVYAQYFGGDIVIQSMPGYGTDVYLNINHLGDIAGVGHRIVAS